MKGRGLNERGLVGMGGAWMEGRGLIGGRYLNEWAGLVGRGRGLAGKGGGAFGVT